MNVSHALITAVDVCYHDHGATAAAIQFADWADEQACAQYLCDIPQVADYQPGQFYRRELPCVLAVLKQLPQQPSMIVIDGHVWLRPGEPGLGWHLHEAIGIPVIGVAKTSFDQSRHAAHVFRGESLKPLFVTAIGMDQQEAARHIESMHGAFRLPTLLKLVDHLCRSGAPAASPDNPPI
ncbi:endonuclease V [Prosthecobacter vanneervenii]|uniref:Deoxyribonuclease V n=1 Tax=Prosthecobacter vanneervenii TaxID=48466 RepID=A0A7W7YES6_9BACT|nr:deoxyribonuclease V [Prosthecobacter vanneervenii]